ncbi:hypothetical protein T492DRAFT_895921 [Pavlovales sp. CCMP2436]|nr:hypothetical protein T492DRAFT_895921 [Pavlovales sp. CCMP2436]
MEKAEYSTGGEDGEDGEGGRRPLRGCEDRDRALARKREARDRERAYEHEDSDRLRDVEKREDRLERRHGREQEWAAERQRVLDEPNALDKLGAKTREDLRARRYDEKCTDDTNAGGQRLMRRSALRQFSTTGNDLKGERSLLLPINVRILSLLALNDEWLSNETATAKLGENVPKLNTKERKMVIKQMEAIMSESDGEVSDVSEDE